MRADREAGLAVVGEHPLPAGEVGQDGRLRGRVEGSGSCFASPRVPSTERGRVASPSSQRRSRRRGPKQSHAPPRTSASSASRETGARRARSPTSSRARSPPAPPRAPRRRPSRPRRRTRGRRGRRATRSRCPTRVGHHRWSLQRAPGVAQVDVGRAHLHPAPLRVADEARGRVEAHRLLVEEAAEELGRVVVTQPGGLVGQEAERGGVRLREAEAREADERVEHPVGHLLRDASRDRPIDEARAVRLERLQAPLAAHRPPQPLCLADREPRERDRDVEHLVLEDDDPERRGERLPQRLVRDGKDERGGPPAAGGGARCTGGRPSPGSAPGGRAPPGW